MSIRIVIGDKDISDFVQTVEWSGNSGVFDRKLNVSVVNTKDGRKQAFKVREGDKIEFSWEGKRLFVGIIFAYDIDVNGNMSLTCYDPNIYLNKSNDSRKFVNKKASDIVRQLAKDFGIPTGTIEDTGYVIPRLIFRNHSLREIILTALTITRKQTGRRFFIGNKDGKLTLTSPAKTADRFILRAGDNLIDASYSLSIEDTKTQVKVIGGDKDKPTIVVERNNTLRQRYGVMQHVEEMGEKATASQVKQRAATLLKEMAVIHDQANVEALGIPEVITGTGVYVVEPMTGLAGGYYVSSDTHRFENGLHTMSLELSRTYDLPPIEISKEVLGEDE